MLFLEKIIAKCKRNLWHICFELINKTNISKFRIIEQDRKVGLDDFLIFKNRLRVNGWVVPADRVKGFLVELSNTTLFYSFEPLPGYDPIEKFGKEAWCAKFNLEVPLSNDQISADIKLWCVLSGKKIFHVNIHPVQIYNRNPDQNLFNSFIEQVKSLANGTVLEIGSRNRSNLVRKGLIPSQMSYIGMDISPGDNVDIVGDAHKLSSLFPPEHFDAVFSVAVFEHLLMPWMVAVEMNAVMKMGAIAFIHSHHTYPLHEQPWDFWRYTDQAWQALFNGYSGFEILETQMDLPAYILPRYLSKYHLDTHHAPAYLNSTVTVKKIGKTTLRWQADPQKILSGNYSH